MIRRTTHSLALIGMAALGVLALGAAKRPAALSLVSGGLWEVSSSATGSNPRRLCVPDPLVLVHYEHRSAGCDQLLIADKPSEAVVNYTCPGGGFGRTKMTILTPRSMRVETQGISHNEPFNYVLQARRVGNCPGR